VREYQLTQELLYMQQASSTTAPSLLDALSESGGGVVNVVNASSSPNRDQQVDESVLSLLAASPVSPPLPTCIAAAAAAAAVAAAAAAVAVGEGGSGAAAAATTATTTVTATATTALALKVKRDAESAARQQKLSRLSAADAIRFKRREKKQALENERREKAEAAMARKQALLDKQRWTAAREQEEKVRDLLM
jgi:hypothetical protein